MVHHDGETAEVDLADLAALRGQDPHIDYREDAEPNEVGKIPATVTSYEPEGDGRSGTLINNDVYVPAENFEDDDLREVEDRSAPAHGWVRIRFEDVEEDRFLGLLDGVEAYIDE